MILKLSRTHVFKQHSGLNFEWSLNSIMTIILSGFYFEW